MKFLPIEAEEHLNARFRKHTQCSEVLSVFTGLYHKVGFNKPWIAYFVTDDSDNIVGGAGFKGKPSDGKVEISYVSSFCKVSQLDNRSKIYMEL